MKNKLIRNIITMILIIPLNAFSSDIDILLDHLVDKGIIDGPTAHEIRYQTEEEAKRQISKGTHRILPLWLQYLTIGGDLRIRYQHDANDNLTYERKRTRIRGRINLNSKINENSYIYIGLATGENDDPRSTNQTFTNNFSKKGIYFDYGYFEWFITSQFIFSAGKIRNPFFISNDAIWDSDINQEGFTLTYDRSITSLFRTQAKAGLFILRENSNTKDQKLNYFSLKNDFRNYDSTFKGWFSMSAYDFKNIKGASPFSNRPSTTSYQQSNTLISSKYGYSYRILSTDLEITKLLENPINLYINDIKAVSIFSTILRNTAVSDSKHTQAYIWGIRIGHERVQEQGEFQISFAKRYIEKESFLDTYPDSDFFGGATDVKGYKASLTLGLGYNSNININYFYAKPILSSKKKDNIVQVDFNLKF